MNTTDKIMALADKYAFYVPGSTLSDAAREAMRAEIDALVRDAERYQWLRNMAGISEWDSLAVYFGYCLDEAIDAAMQEKQS